MIEIDYIFSPWSGILSCKGAFDLDNRPFSAHVIKKARFRILFDRSLPHLFDGNAILHDATKSGET